MSAVIWCTPRNRISKMFTKTQISRSVANQGRGVRCAIFAIYPILRLCVSIFAKPPFQMREGFKSCLLLIGNCRVMQSCASSIVSHHPDATIPLPQPSSNEIALNVDAPPGPSSPFLFCRAQKCQAQPFFGSGLFDKRRIFCTLNANISECETSLQPDMRFVVLH